MKYMVTLVFCSICGGDAQLVVTLVFPLKNFLSQMSRQPLPVKFRTLGFSPSSDCFYYSLLFIAFILFTPCSFNKTRLPKGS